MASFIFDPYWIISAVIAVLLCSLPTGLIISKVFMGYDIRETGSKNIGMTNVMRTGGLIPGIFTFLGDTLKGTLAVFIYAWLTNDFSVAGEVCIALIAVISHTKSIYLKFKGGKGVATYFGVWLALDWRAALIGMSGWLLFYKITKISSIGSLASLIVLCVTVFWLQTDVLYFLLSLVLLIYIAALHKQNIVRLLKGEETAMVKKK